MRKSPYRDYATDGYRLYAQLGGPAAYKSKLWNEAIAEHNIESARSGISNPTESAVMRAEKRIEEYEAILKDLEAADSAMRIIGRMKEGPYIAAALKMVYMKDPFINLERNVISARVTAAHTCIGASEMTIYRWLAKARLIFATERGLRT